MTDNEQDERDERNAGRREAAFWLFIAMMMLIVAFA